MTGNSCGIVFSTIETIMFLFTVFNAFRKPIFQISRFSINKKSRCVIDYITTIRSHKTKLNGSEHVTQRLFNLRAADFCNKTT